MRRRDVFAPGSRVLAWPPGKVAHVLDVMRDGLEFTSYGSFQKAFEMIKTEITEATTSMTSVPKPLKFLSPVYSKLTDAYKLCTTEDDFKVSGY